ncbi:MAG: EAL domain-containing protein [Ilumatobacteraceae bacterium]
MDLAPPELATNFESRRLPGFEGLVAIDGNGTIQYVSPSLDGRFGVDSVSAIGRNFLEFVHSNDSGQAGKSFGAVLDRPGFHQALEIRIGAPGGEGIRVHAVAENCLHEDELSAVLMNLADSRDRQRSILLLEAQAEVVRQIALGGSLRASLGSVMAFVENALPGFVAVAYLQDDDGYIGIGNDRLPPESVARIADALSTEPSYVGTIAVASQNVEVAVLSDDELWATTTRIVGSGPRCVWSTPIRHERGDPTRGHLEIYGPDPVFPRDEDWIVLRLVSRLAAVAVDHSVMQRQMARDAHVDPLTTVPNRRVITTRLAELLAAGQRPIVCFIDLDHLKVVNDGLGHEAGDQVILAAAERLGAAVGPAGMVGRFGGDEFVAIVDGQHYNPQRMAEACLRAFDEPIPVAGRQWKLSASIGLVVVDGQTNPGEVLRDADAAMYEAKRAGRGRWVRFGSGTRATVLRRMELEPQLRTAVNRGSIEGWLQPIVRTSDWSLAGAEVLARWRTAAGEWVSPVDFIALAEEIGVIDDLGLLMIEHALHARRLLVERGLGDAFVSVNVSPVQLHSDRIFDHLRGSGPGVHRHLHFEMTEQHIIDDSEETLVRLQRLLDLGVKLAVDDFGTGYSSLGALNQIPASTLKIDRSLIARLGSRSGEAVVAAVVGVAKAYDLMTVAEGVETPEQALRARDLGVDAVQGYLFAHPAPLPALLARLARPAWSWDASYSVLQPNTALQLTLA